MRANPEKIKQLMSSVVPALLAGKDLSADFAAKLFERLFSGELNETQAKTVLLLLALKGETSDELWGAVRALRKLERAIGPTVRGLIDTCGTGGDQSQSINISTLAAFVVAGAGCKVAKHGNRAISSRSGSSDLVESLGVRIDAPASRMFNALRRAGIGYFHAPFYHPVFAKFQPLRRAIKRRTILNLLGPLVNPMKLDHQLVGVSEKRLLPLYAKVLARLGRRSALVCHSSDGMDEISTSLPTHVAWVTNGKVRLASIEPKGLGLKRATRGRLRVTDPKRSHRIARDILSGKEKGPKRDAVVLNAAYALRIAGKTRTLRDAVLKAQASIDSGKALQALNGLKKIAGGS